MCESILFMHSHSSSSAEIKPLTQQLPAYLHGNPSNVSRVEISWRISIFPWKVVVVVGVVEGSIGQGHHMPQRRTLALVYIQHSQWERQRQSGQKLSVERGWNMPTSTLASHLTWDWYMAYTLLHNLPNSKPFCNMHHQGHCEWVTVKICHRWVGFLLTAYSP